MFYLLNIFDLNTWQILLNWIIPFLFALLIAWFLWGKYKRRYYETANERDDLMDDLIELEKKLERCEDESKTLTKESKSSEKQLDKSMIIEVDEEEVSQTMVFGIPRNKFVALDNDNLQIIEGVGPKMSEYLHGKGINSWETLAGYDEHFLKKLLAEEGKKYQIIDPTSWPAQANLASKGDWEKLITLQKNLAAGKKKKGKTSDSKVEKILIRLGVLKKWKQDDLKAIEGIGPKIEGLLHEAKILSWEALAGAEKEQLRSILNEAGKRYQLADPGTWPEQAKLAFEGKWNELDILQEKLKGGKKV